MDIEIPGEQTVEPIELPQATATEAAVVAEPNPEPRKKPGPKPKQAPIETVGQPSKGRWFLSDGTDEGLDVGWNWVGPAQENA